MNSRKQAILIIFILLIVVFFQSCAKKEPVEIVLPEGKKAEIIFLVGEVFITSDTGGWIKAKVGDILGEGTKIRTNENSYCEIVINSGTIFRMKDRSELQLVMLPVDEKQNKSFIQLAKGGLFSKTQKITYRSDDTIATSTSTLGVRGTEYLVSTTGSGVSEYTEVLVFKGVVKVKMNVREPSAPDIPRELKSLMRRVNRGVNVKEGYKIKVTQHRVAGIEESIDQIVRQKEVDEALLSELKQDILLRPEPMKDRDRIKYEEIKDLTLSFKTGETVYLSPNFDGVNDEFVLLPGELAGEKVAGCKLVILDGRSTIKRELQSRRSEEGNHVQIPEQITWNCVDHKGITPPDGNYVYEFYTIDKGQKELLRIKGRIIIDTHPPEIVLTTEDKIFSPNEDGVKDTIPIDIQAESEIQWTCMITTPEGITVRSIEWGAAIPDVFEWDGKGENGNVLPDGVYNIIISGKDLAGNGTTQIIEGVTLDVRERSATVDVDYPIISPNNDGKFDTITFFPYLSDRSRIDTWDLIVQTEKGDTARRFRGLRYIPQSIVWDGTPQKGKMYDYLPEELPTGKYYYFLKVIYRSGVNTFSYKKELILDNDPPVIDVKISPGIFSPDGDGENDILFIRPGISDLTPIVYWNAAIYTKSDRVFKRFSGSKMPAAELTWDGVSDSGQLVDSGEDCYLLFEATDSALNRGTSDKIPFSVDILVITTERGLKIMVSNIEFGFNTAQLQGDKTFALLLRGVEVLKKYGKYKIIIEGHTDSTGDENYNLVLSEKRAESVGRFLIENGINAGRISYKGYGSTYPIDTNATPEGRARNRRVEFILQREK